MGLQSSSSPVFPFCCMYLYIHNTLLLKVFNRKALIKTVLDFVLVTVNYDFQHCLGICLMSVEIDQVSNVMAVFLVLEITTFYKKL